MELVAVRFLGQQEEAHSHSYFGSFALRLLRKVAALGPSN